MKWFLRILMILAAALVVVGMTFALNQSGVLQMEGPERSEQALLSQPSGTDEGNSQEFSRPERGEHPEGGVGIFGAVEVLKSLVIVSVIVAIVAGVSTLWKRVRGRLGRDRRVSAPKAQAAPQ